MKISASILAADQNNIINNLNDKKGLFDYVHIDIGDNVFCPTYGISKNNVYKLVNETTYKLDIHLMIDEFPEFVLALAEENWIRGYQQALDDITEGEKLYKQELAKAEDENSEE